MSRRPKLSVVTTTYNHERYIAAALESFVGQDVNFEIEAIVADDCSTDGTPRIVQEYADRYPKIIKPILRKKNIGAVENTIKALQTARGEYIALCEGDDFWTDPQKLQKQVDFMDANKNISLSFHPIRVFFENNEGKESIWPNLGRAPNTSIEHLLEENFIPTNSVVYRRREYKNMPREVMPFDWYLHLYHAQYGEIGMIDEVMSAYRRHSEGLWWDSHKDASKLWIAFGESMLNLFQKVSQIYGDNPAHLKIIEHSMAVIAGHMADVDISHKTGLIQSVMKKFPSTAEKVIFWQHEAIKNEQILLDQKQQEIENLNAEIIDLRAQVFGLRDELHGLKNSRVLGRIIKVRATIGDFIHTRKLRNIPWWILRKVKKIIGIFLPKALKHWLRSLVIKAYVSFRKSISKKPEIKYSRVKNKPWDKAAPLVSVVIPYFNRESTIDDTLNSLESQTFIDFEVILVNDGSTDQASIDKLEIIKTTHPKVKIIDQKNQGVAVARNNGIREAKGKYVLCLDSDDMIDPTFIEKAILVLESSPDVSMITTNRSDFGVLQDEFKYSEFNPLHLYRDNMVITAALFRRVAWESSEGYKSNIGYEDWEFWLSLAENGYWGKLIPEALFKYRTSLQSRYIEDKDLHWKNIKTIHQLHPEYRKRVKRLLKTREGKVHITEPQEAFLNISRPGQYRLHDKSKKNILITMPWMTFGGAETLVYNYCREIKGRYNITFVTGLKSEHEWEYKFREISENIYHLPNLFDDQKKYVEFLSNLVTTRKIGVLHIVHNGFMFNMLPELKERHPDLEVVLTLFNDRVPEYVRGAEDYQEYIDKFVTDNSKVADNLNKQLKTKSYEVIPNGIDAYDEFNPVLFDRELMRKQLNLGSEDLAVFFVGRLSVEKNPDVFVEAARALMRRQPTAKVKFFVIGDGPQRHDIERMIKGSEKYITYLGYQSEIARYLSAADVFVLPSAIEGFPLSILEAMAMNVAVIASNVGAVSEVIQDGIDGFVIKPGSEEDITTRIEDLLQDKGKLAKIKSSGRKKVEEKYSNRVLGANYIRLYESIIK